MSGVACREGYQESKGWVARAGEDLEMSLKETIDGSVECTDGIAPRPTLDTPTPVTRHPTSPPSFSLINLIEIWDFFKKNIAVFFIIYLAGIVLQAIGNYQIFYF